MRKTLLLIVALAVLCAPALANAQGAQRLTRPYRGLFGGGPPPDPTRMRHELSLNAGLQTGWDDVVAPQGGDPQPGVEQRSGYSGFGNASLEYFFGRAGRSISAQGSTYTQAYSGVGVDPIIGGDLRFGAETGLGRKMRLQFAQDLQYQPSLVLGSFASLEGDVDSSLLPETGSTSGLVEQRSWAFGTQVDIERRWTARHTTSADYGFSKRVYTNSIGYDNQSQSVSARHEWSASRTVRVHGSYRFSDGVLFESPTVTTSLNDHAFQAGLGYSRRLSATRQIHFSGGGGATYVETLSPVDRAPQAYWMPSGSGTIRVDLARTWSLSTDYRRAVSVLSGVSLQSFATDALRVGVDGAVNRRMELGMSVSYANGRAGAGDSLGRFASYSGVAQMRYAISRCCAAMVNYDYYYYSLNDVQNVPTGLPSQYDRNSLRVGITLWLPLYGSYGDRGDGRGASRSR